MHEPGAYVVHATGLVSMLKEHRMHLRGKADDQDDEERLINTVIFQSNFATGVSGVPR
jgi:hypothetical protein